MEGSFRKLRLQVKSRQIPLRGCGEPAQGGPIPSDPPHREQLRENWGRGAGTSSPPTTLAGSERDPASG